jgi:hypothetical protein
MHPFKDYLMPLSILLPRRLFNLALPATDTLARQDLPRLAHLHLTSAKQLMATVKLLTPPTCIQDHILGGQFQSEFHRAFASLPRHVDSMVLTLVDLQLFHLHRAKAITQQMRGHTTQGMQQQQQQQEEEEEEEEECSAASSGQPGQESCFANALIWFLE